MKHIESDEIIGLLRQWVEGRCLGEIDIANTATEKRTRWASQIREALDHLHQMGVVWGDGKPRNIIGDDDVWLIDFGGSYTEGWVHRELAGTVDGDEQVFRRILAYLKV